MLQLKQVTKIYTTGELTQKALDGVNLSFRSNEFVAVLGVSGSGKTTMLNIIGGLDRYTSGDLLINGISTKDYNDRDWDTYRNHRIGFVFQSYNLIVHQSVLANVELALTISGTSRKQRRQRALEALTKVGLKEHAHKRPNQLSGGQMQRVAIARALVNNPDILLADEPTGALDSQTSLQVMELLKEVAKDRLVIMVTHNAALARQYASRIVELKDGQVMSDTHPYQIETKKETLSVKLRKASMSFLTSLSLSFNNLWTKKFRTLLTAFAGSIGIIGIALIISLSSGANQYIRDIQKETMASYPIVVEAQSFDMSSAMDMGTNHTHEKPAHPKDGIYGNPLMLQRISKMISSITENNLTKFKETLDNPNSEVHKYLGEHGVVYSYDVKYRIYTYDTEGELIDTDGITIKERDNSNKGRVVNFSPVDDSLFQPLVAGKDQSVSQIMLNHYRLIKGFWPKEVDEAVIVLDKNNETNLQELYFLGLLPSKDYLEIYERFNKNEALDLETIKIDYDKAIGHEYYFLPEVDHYYLENNRAVKLEQNSETISQHLDKAKKVKIVGVVALNENKQEGLFLGTVGYLPQLNHQIMEETHENEIVKKQIANKEISIFSGLRFSTDNDAQKIEDAKKYVKDLNISDKARLFIRLSSQIQGQPLVPDETMDETMIAQAFDLYLQNPQDEVLLMIYDRFISTGTYDEVLKTLGVVSFETPSKISLYTDSFEDKDGVANWIKSYNDTVDEQDKIVYTDYVGLLMSSVTTIINVISAVLIAFVAVSLIVSSIMIGIITYISVLERTKEIGILRALGASKRNIASVFNAETFIIGLTSGLMGIIVANLILIPGNQIIAQLAANVNVRAFIPWEAMVMLVVLSCILTLIGGFIPARKAAKKDPVEALRTE